MYNWIKQLKNYIELNLKDNRTTYLFFCIGIYIVLIFAGITKNLFLPDSLQVLHLPINTILIILTGLTFIIAELVVGFKIIDIFKKKYEFSLLPFNKSAIISGTYILLILWSFINSVFSVLTVKVLEWIITKEKSGFMQFDFEIITYIDILFTILIFFSFFMFLYLIKSNKSSIKNFIMIVTTLFIASYLSKFYIYLENNILENSNLSIILLFLSYLGAVFLSSKYKNQYLK